MNQMECTPVDYVVIPVCLFACFFGGLTFGFIRAYDVIAKAADYDTVVASNRTLKNKLHELESRISDAVYSLNGECECIDSTDSDSS